MTLAQDFPTHFCDFTAAQLVAVGTRIGEVLKGLPPQDLFHRQLASDLIEEIGILSRILSARQNGKLDSTKDGLDAERMQLYSGLAQIIRAGCRHPFAAKAEASLRLCQTLERHGLATQPTGPEDRTAELDLFFAGFDHAPFQLDLTALDLLSWYQKLKTVHAQYLESAKEELSAARKTESLAPPVHEVRHRLAALLSLICQGIRHQSRKARAPYDRLTTRLDEALSATRTGNPRHSRHSVSGKSTPPAQAALNG